MDCQIPKTIEVLVLVVVGNFFYVICLWHQFIYCPVVLKIYLIMILGEKAKSNVEETNILFDAVEKILPSFPKRCLSLSLLIT